MDPLEVLELQQDYTEEDVKRNFRRLSFLYHPDKHPNDKKAIESFKDLVDAYELIKKNPALLHKNTLFTSPIDTLFTEINVTIEDLYFERSKTADLKRIIPCPTCNGFGTTDIEQGLCTLCRGTGHIDNKILNMMKKNIDYSCPLCKGSGVKKGYACTSCKGKKFKEEIKTYTFHANLKNFNNKCIVLNGEGNQYPPNQESHVVIKLKIKEDSIYRIENECLCIDFNITPAQSLIGDTCEVLIFNKIFRFKVPVIDNRIVIEDKRKEFSYPRKILIKTIISKPVMNKEIKELYEKILLLEKTINNYIPVLPNPSSPRSVLLRS